MLSHHSLKAPTSYCCWHRVVGVVIPYSDWELGFSLLPWRESTNELKKCTIAMQHLKNGNQVLLYLMLATPPGYCGS